jgi:hypothetical protein
VNHKFTVYATMAGKTIARRSFQSRIHSSAKPADAARDFVHPAKASDALILF